MRWTETGAETSTHSAHPDLSTAELLVVFDRKDDSGQRAIYAGDRHSNSSRRLDDGQCDAHHPALSSDGPYLAYLCGEPLELKECSLHVVDRWIGERLDTHCPVAPEPEYRLYFTEESAEVSLLPLRWPE